MDVNEPFSIALSFGLPDQNLVIMWQHSLPLSLAKPRQYLESYNRKAYVRPPTAWATAEKTGKCWKISASQCNVWRCLKISFQQWDIMFNIFHNARSAIQLCLILVIFVSNSGWETSEPILWSLHIPTLDWPNAKIAAGLPVPETHRADRGVLRSVQNGGNCTEITHLWQLE